LGNAFFFTNFKEIDMGSGGLLAGFDTQMRELLGFQMAQEVRQTKENIAMDELKHKGKLISDAGQIAQ
jgi:hypothetical protein